MTLEQGNNGFVLMTGKSNPRLARAIGDELGKPVLEPVSNFADGETRVFIENSLRKSDVVIIHSTSPPVNDSVVELLLMIDAARRASAGEITAMIPYFGYARQDKKDGPRVPISAKVMAHLIEAEQARRIVTMDVHVPQLQGFVECPWDDLTARRVLLEPLKALNLTRLVISSTDHGGIERAKEYRHPLNADSVGVVYKERPDHDQSEVEDMLGEVDKRNVIFVDDILSTASSLQGAATFVESRGAEEIYAAVTHGLFVGDALQRIQDSPIKKLFITDTVAQRDEVLAEPKIQVVTIAGFLAEAVRRIQRGDSMSVDMF